MELIGNHLALPDGGEVHVVECPGCLFNGMQICLSTKDKAELPKLKYMAGQYHQWYREQAARIQSSQLVVRPGRGAIRLQGKN